MYGQCTVTLRQCTINVCQSTVNIRQSTGNVLPGAVSVVPIATGCRRLKATASNPSEFVSQAILIVSVASPTVNSYVYYKFRKQKQYRQRHTILYETTARKGTVPGA